VRRKTGTLWNGEFSKEPRTKFEEGTHGVGALDGCGAGGIGVCATGVIPPCFAKKRLENVENKRNERAKQG
jgi:hypothetical protein